MSIDLTAPVSHISKSDDKPLRKGRGKSDIQSSSTHRKLGEKKRKRDQDTSDERSNTTKKHRAKASNEKANNADSSPSSKSPFYKQTSSLYLPLSPICQRHPLEGLCAEHISPLILTYYPPFRAVILSYGNVQLCERPVVQDSHRDGEVLARSIDEYAASYVWVTADFLLFKPRKGEVLEGYINLQNEGLLGLVCWNLFNASIERKRLPTDWRWIPAGGNMNGRRGTTQGDNDHQEAFDHEERGEGHFEDSEGHKIEGMIKFRVRDVESSGREKGFVSIEGTMLGEEQEKILEEQMREEDVSQQASKGEHMRNKEASRLSESGRTMAREGDLNN